MTPETGSDSTAPDTGLDSIQVTLETDLHVTPVTGLGTTEITPIPGLLKRFTNTGSGAQRRILVATAPVGEILPSSQRLYRT
jgi:hypothetical protein